MDTFGRAYTHRRPAAHRRLAAAVAAQGRPEPVLHAASAAAACRSEPVTEIVAERLVDGGARPDTSAEWTELRQIVREGIAGLSVKHQSVVILYYLEGRSLQETADALELPLGTVKSRIHHALRDLRGPPQRRPPLRRRLGRGGVSRRPGARRGPWSCPARLPPAPHRRLEATSSIGGERGPATPGRARPPARAASVCERDLTELALTVAALRRAGRELRAAPVPVADAVARRRARRAAQDGLVAGGSSSAASHRRRDRGARRRPAHEHRALRSTSDADGLSRPARHRRLAARGVPHRGASPTARRSPP